MIAGFREVHVENTNACGYKCIMCPREQLSRPLGYMSLTDMELLADRLKGFAGTFHLHGFGEPLLDRALAPKVALLQDKFPGCPKYIFSTLGVRIKKEGFEKLAEAGLDRIVVSLYGFNSDQYKSVHGYNGFDLVKENLECLAEIQRNPLYPLRVVIKIPGRTVASSLSLLQDSERDAFCAWAEGLGFEIREWAAVHNYGSGRTYNTPETEGVCPVVSGKRKEILNITWDLRVIPCGLDFNATMSWGNLREQSLEEIFSGFPYLSFLLAHQTGALAEYPVCRNCEKGDYF